MKKIIPFILVITIILCSCSNMSESEKIVLNQKKIIKENTINVFEAIKQHDSTAMLNMFCNNSKQNSDCEGDISKVFDFIDGDLVSYEDISNLETNESVRNGETVKLDAYPDMIGVKTDTNHLYQISVQIVLICEDADYEGITQIYIKDIETQEYINIGSPFDY